MKYREGERERESAYIEIEEISFFFFFFFGKEFETSKIYNYPQKQNIVGSLADNVGRLYSLFKFHWVSPHRVKRGITEKEKIGEKLKIYIDTDKVVTH